MASGQSKEVSWKVLDGDGAKRDLRRRKEKTAPLGQGRERSDMGKALNSSPKASLRKRAGGLQSMPQPVVAVEGGRKDKGLEREWASFKT